MGCAKHSTASERLSAAVRLDHATGCHEWTKTITGGGYGYLVVDGANRPAHRYAYELAFGPIPAGLQIDHLCRNRKCCNPAHLEAVTQRTNILRGVGVSAINLAKTHCPAGHPYVEGNIYYEGAQRAFRRCRECRLAQTRRRRLTRQEDSRC